MSHSGEQTERGSSEWIRREHGKCVQGVGSVHSAGYLVRHHNGRLDYAHRIAWEEAHGPIAADLVVHHVCENKKCVNLSHLRLLSQSQHTAHHNPPIVVCPKCGSTDRREIRTRPGKTYCAECHRTRERNRPKRRRKDYREGAILVLCACGCGKEVSSLRSDGKPRLYAWGHNPRPS